MSFMKARAKSISNPSAAEESEKKLMCRMPSCRNLWTADFQHGKVCSFHYASLCQVGAARSESEKLGHRGLMSLGEVVRPFCEPPEMDDQ